MHEISELISGMLGLRLAPEDFSFGQISAAA
jgi:hypothetical protein